MEDWKILGTYTSEAEARVVESFLRAQGLEVQVLDSHMNAYAPSSLGDGRGMRLMVRARDFAHAEELLSATSRQSHLEIVGEEQPVEKSPVERWMLFLALLIGAIYLALAYLRPS